MFTLLIHFVLSFFYLFLISLCVFVSFLFCALYVHLLSRYVLVSTFHLSNVNLISVLSCVIKCAFLYTLHLSFCYSNLLSFCVHLCLTWDNEVTLDVVDLKAITSFWRHLTSLNWKNESTAAALDRSINQTQGRLLQNDSLFSSFIWRSFLSPELDHVLEGKKFNSLVMSGLLFAFRWNVQKSILKS